MQINIFRRDSSRLAWALLASLLVHLAIIGDIGILHWWWPIAPDAMPSSLEVQILPLETPVKQPLPPVSKQIIPDPQPPSPPQQSPDTGMPASSPVPESIIAVEPQQAIQDQSPAADSQSVSTPLPDKQDEDKVAQRLPPNGKLVYRFYWGKSRWLAGLAIHQWVIENGNYTLSSTVSTTGLFQFFHPIKMVEIAKGKIIGDTLRPMEFSTQFNENPPAVAIFDWGTGLYRWSRGKAFFSQPLSRNSYDKISYLYQLYLTQEKEKYLSPEITIGRRLEHYDILNLGVEDVEIDGMPHQAVHLKRATTAPDMEKIDIWLSTAMNNFPLKMTYENRAGDYFEQLIAIDSLPAH